MPVPGLPMTTGETIEELLDSTEKLRKELEWLLQNLDSSNVKELNADVINAGVISAQHIQVGSGTHFEDGYDPNALAGSLGELAYEDAVELARLGTTIIDGGYIKTGLVDASRIDTGTLNVNRISVLPDYKISSADQWNTQGTYIDQYGVYTGTLTADQIYGGTISGVNINVDTNVRIGESLVLNRATVSGGIRWGEQAFAPAIYVNPVDGSIHIDNYSGTGVYAHGRRIDVEPVAKFG